MNKELPVGLILITMWLVFCGLYSIWLGFRYGLELFGISGLIIFTLLGCGLIKLKNIARIGTIILIVFFIFFDVIFSLGVYGSIATFFRILISIDIIYYLTRPKIKKLFRALKTESNQD